MNKNRLMLITAILVGLGSQIHLSYKMPGFIITLAVILMVVLMYLFKLNYHKTIFLTAIVSPFMRGIFYLLKGNNLAKTIENVSPDIVFYLVFGLVFYFFKKFSKDNITYFLLIVFFADVVSNTFELLVRSIVSNSPFSEVLNLVFVIALIRVTIVLLIIFFYYKYKSFLKKEEHEKKYRKLLLMQSYFKSEIYFMEKNISEIENVMNDSFKLHKMLKDDKKSELSLEIAKNIHEIKKDYIRVIDGLNEYTLEDKNEKESLVLKDLLDILITNTKEYINKKDKNIKLEVLNKTPKLKVKKHYYLISIIRNLINNSIESIKGQGIIEIKAFKKGNFLNLKIKDNGCGIKERDLKYIFNIGYSTKLESKEGKFKRGIGLSLVKDLVEKKFKGSISVKSTIDKGTIFNIKLSISDL
ncbi:MAG: ATP-binding protein [Bacillota bacterium]